MTTKLPPPVRKDPTRRTRLPTRPPGNRSREAHGLTAMAAAGRFALQTCADCGTVQYPPRQICGRCLGDRLEWRDVADGGRLLAETTLAHSNDLFFRDRLPWRLGVVEADAGPSMVAHLAEDCAAGERVRLALSIDRAGNAVVTARPETPTPNPEDDRQLREMAFDPKDRRVLIVDGKTELGLALVRAFADAGARRIYVGHAQPWRKSAQLEAARAVERATLFPLDLTDTDSVEELAATIGVVDESQIPGTDADGVEKHVALIVGDLHRRAPWTGFAIRQGFGCAVGRHGDVPFPKPAILRRRGDACRRPFPRTRERARRRPSWGTPEDSDAVRGTSFRTAGRREGVPYRARTAAAKVSTIRL